MIQTCMCISMFSALVFIINNKTVLYITLCWSFRRVRWSVCRSLTCSKSSSPRRHGCSFLFCVELHNVQCMRIQPVLLNKVDIHCFITISHMLVYYYDVFYIQQVLFVVVITDWCLCISGLVGPAPPSTRWMCLTMDLRYVLSVYLNRTHSHLKSIKLCANMSVKNIITSDLLFDPGTFWFCSFTVADCELYNIYCQSWEASLSSGTVLCKLNVLLFYFFF